MRGVFKNLDGLRKCSGKCERLLPATVEYFHKANVKMKNGQIWSGLRPECKDCKNDKRNSKIRICPSCKINRLEYHKKYCSECTEINDRMSKDIAQHKWLKGNGKEYFKEYHRNKK
jgi:hypothetical protein